MRATPLSHEKIQGLIKCEGVTIAFMPRTKIIFVFESMFIKIGDSETKGLE